MKLQHLTYIPETMLPDIGGLRITVLAVCGPQSGCVDAMDGLIDRGERESRLTTYPTMQGKYTAKLVHCGDAHDNGGRLFWLP